MSLPPPAVDLPLFLSVRISSKLSFRTTKSRLWLSTRISVMTSTRMRRRTAKEGHKTRRGDGGQLIHSSLQRKMNEYELQRAANIAKNQELLKEVGLFGKSVIPQRSYGDQQVKKSASTSHAKRKPPIKREPVDVGPRRTSARLSGMPAESEAARKKAELEHEAFVEAERAKRRRVEGPIELVDVIQDGDTWEDAKGILADITRKPVAREYRPRAEHPDDSARLKSIRKELSGLTLHNRHEVNDVRITPERIYCVGMHPGVDKKLCLAGDKIGFLGMWDVDAVDIKTESKGGDMADDDDDGEEEVALPKIHQFKLHARTISSLTFDPVDGNKLYTASYDCSVRCLDLPTGKATEVHANDDDTAYTTIEVLPDGSGVYMSDFDGNVGRRDLRGRGGLQLHNLHDRKIGGMGMHPRDSHIICTASLDRTMKVWDWRMMRKTRAASSSSGILPLAVYTCGLSVSSADFNSDGAVLTTSYDDKLSVFDGPFSGKEEEIEPDHIVGHDNRTGRWLTVFKAHWQADPADGVQKFCIGNMRRHVDLYDASGNRLAQLVNEQITAIPAVVEFHPSQNWVIAGNASGKCLFWS